MTRRRPPDHRPISKVAPTDNFRPDIPGSRRTPGRDREERQGDVLRESLGHRTCDVDESKYYSEMALDVQVVIVQISDLSELHPMSPQRKLCCTHAVPRHRPQCSREVDREGNQ